MRFLVSLHYHIIIVVILCCYVGSGNVICQTSTPVKIAFASDIDGDWDIYLTDSVGNTPVNLTANDTADYYPMWSPDGKKLTFSSEVDGRWVIHLMNADGSKRRELIDNGAWATQLKWQHTSSELQIELINLQYKRWGEIKTQ